MTSSGFLTGMVDRGSAVNANRLLAVLRRFFNWCVERGHISLSPVEKMKPPTAETARDRVLSDDELRNAWRAFDRVGHPFGPIAKLLALTGARRDEIAAATWGEIDLDAKTWTIAKEWSKNGLAHEIPLSDSAVEIIKSLPRVEPARDEKTGKAAPAYVFTTTRRSTVSGWDRAKERIDTAIFKVLQNDAEEAGPDPEKVEAPPHWVLHDLRRTAASGMAGLGVAPHVVEAVLNHKSGTIKGVAAVYNRYNYAIEKRAALDAWGRKPRPPPSSRHRTYLSREPSSNVRQSQFCTPKHRCLTNPARDRKSPWPALRATPRLGTRSAARQENVRLVSSARAH